VTENSESLGELVAANPEAARVLHARGLDYCCRGSRSLQQACADAGLDPAEVLAEIQRANASEGSATRWDERPLAELIQHILDRYHEPLRQQLPRLVELASLVESAHVDNPDRPTGLAQLLAEVNTAVASHLAKEEQILFPVILSGRGHAARMPVQAMVVEHEDHGENLRRIRELTNELCAPQSACVSWRELYRSLAELEVELMDHIHLENNILFVRALNV